MDIEINKLDGVRLKTANTYLEEDINLFVKDEAINEKLTEITIDKDGTYEPTDDKLGFSKVVVDTNKPKQVAQIVVPEQGNWASAFTFDIDEEWALLSNSSDGLWLSNKLTGENTRLVDAGSFASFYQIKDRVVMPSNSSFYKGVWVYYHNTKTAEIRYDVGYGVSSNPAVINDDFFLYRSGSGLIKYNYKEDVVTEILLDNKSLTNVGSFYNYNDKIIFKREDGNVGGLYGFYIYDNNTQTVRLLLETMVASQIATITVDSGYFVSYRDKDDSTIYYLAKFDEDTESFISINIDSKFSFGSNYFLINENGTLFWSGSSAFKGAWWYDAKNKTLEKSLDNEGYQYNRGKVLDNYMFLAGPSSSTNPGWFLFNTETKTWFNPVVGGDSYYSLKAGKYIFVASSSSTSKSLYLFNTETLETKTLNTSATWTTPSLLVINDRILLSCNFIFYTSDETIKSQSIGIIRRYEIDGNYVYWTTAGGGNSGSQYCYIYEEDKFYKGGGSLLDEIEIVDGVCYSFSSDGKLPEKFKFDKNKKAWQLASIYKGEV